MKTLFILFIFTSSTFAGSEYVISRNNKITVVKCKKAKSNDHGERFQTKKLCQKALKEQCDQNIFAGNSMQGNKCKRNKVKRYVLKEIKGKTLKCKKAKWNEYSETYQTKSKCLEVLKNKCGKDGHIDFYLKGNKCKKSTKYAIVPSDNLDRIKCKKANPWNNGRTRYATIDECLKVLKKDCEHRKIYVLKGRTCKRVASFIIQANMDDTIYKCKKANRIDIQVTKKDKGFYLTKNKCIKQLKIQCGQKKEEGFTMKGKKCKK